MATGTNGLLSSTSLSPSLSSDHQPSSTSSMLSVDQNNGSQLSCLYCKKGGSPKPIALDCTDYDAAHVPMIRFDGHRVQPSCMGCWEGGRAAAFCRDCAHFLCTDCIACHQRILRYRQHRVQNDLNVPTVEALSSWLLEEQLRAIKNISAWIAELNQEQVLWATKLAKFQKAEEQDKIRGLIENVQIELERGQAFLKRLFKSVAVRKLQDRDDNEKIELLADEIADLQCVQVQLECKLANSEKNLVATQALLASNQLDELSLTVMCSICLTKRISMTFQCGHLSCGDCSNRVFRCHVCRQLIGQRTRIFL